MKQYDPLGAAFRCAGRRDPHSDECALWWSGSGVTARLACARLEADIEAPQSEHAAWIAVSADGATIARFPLVPGQRRYALLCGMDPTVPHEIAVTRDTQPTGDETGSVILRAIHTDGKPEAPAPKPRTIEFLGDSLTVGEGLMGPVSAMEWRMSWISNHNAFPALAAARLNAERRVVAMGGWGVWRGWDGDETHRIGLIYDKICGVTPGGDRPFDFSAAPVDAVVVNLGTNDASAVELLDPAERADALWAIRLRAVALLRDIRRREPGAFILWAYGLCGNALEAPLRAAVQAVSAEDPRVAYLALEDCGQDYGARQHPGQHAHARAATQIAEALERHLP